MRFFVNIAKTIKRNLQIQITLVYVLLVLLPVSLLGIYSLYVFSQEIETTVIENTTGNIEHQLKNIDDLYERLNDVALDIILRQDVINMLRTYEGLVDIQGINDYNYIRQQLTNILIRRSELDDVAVALTDVQKEETHLRHVISANAAKTVENVGQSIWYNEYLSNNSNTLLVANISVDDSVVSSDGIAFVRTLLNINRNEEMGIIIATIASRQLENNVNLMVGSAGYSHLVLDSLGNILLSNFDDEAVKSAFLEKRNDRENELTALTPYSLSILGEDYLVISGVSGRSGIEITYIISKNAIFQNIYRIRQMNGFIMLICIFLSLILMSMIYKRVIKPVKAMQRSMSLVGQDDSHMQVITDDSNEIGKLADSFNRMVIAIDQKNLKLVEQEKRKHEYELMVLQYQINPHFLYNTLDSIKWLAIAGGNAAIEKMSQALIALLRKTVSSSKEFVTIREELENLEYYVEIQKIRYYNSFDYITEAEDEVLDSLIPKLTLQPLVENALFHGVFDCGHRGLISVSAKREEEDCVITIFDNGAGLETEKIRRQLSFRSPEKMGLGNVNERIKLYYGVKYGLVFESVKGEYAKVIMRIPYRAQRGAMNLFA